MFNVLQPLQRALAASLLALSFGLNPAAVTRAQEAVRPEERLGVYEAIALAMSHSPALNDFREQIQFKGGERLTSLGLYAPTLTYFREGISTGAAVFAEQRMVLSQTVDFPLLSYHRLRRVGMEQQALLLQLEAASNRLKADVKKAYTELLYTQTLVHLRKREVQLAEALEEAATVRVESGEASGLELMKAEIGLLEAQNSLEDAQRYFQNARYALFQVIGLDPEQQHYAIVFPDTMAYLEVHLDQETVLRELDRQPELRSTDSSQEAAQAGVRQARSTLFPALQIELYPQDYGGGFNRFGFQIGLKLPLWMLPNHRGSVQMAQAEVRRWSWQRQAVYLDLKKQAEQAWHSYETSRQTIHRYHTLIRTRAGELLHLTQEGYRIGELDLLTLLDAQRTYLSSQQRYYDALRDYYFQLIDLERFLGQDIVFNPASAPPHTHADPANP